MTSLSDSYPPFQPTPPDFHFCADRYGENLDVESCLGAAHHFLDRGFLRPVTYKVTGDGPHVLPWVSQVGGCTIQIDRAGPAVNNQGFGFDPIDTAGKMGWLVRQCVSDRGGIGGYMTIGIRELFDYVRGEHARQTNFNLPYPGDTSFVTVSVRGPGGAPEPGNYDPIVPTALWITRGRDGVPPTKGDPFYRAAKMMRRQTVQVDLLPLRPWWDCVL